MRVFKLSFVVILVCITFVLSSCASNSNSSKAVKKMSKYPINADFNANNKATYYDNLDYYGYYDFLEFLNKIEYSNIKPNYNIEKDVDPSYLIKGYDKGTYWEINYDDLARNYYYNFQSAVRQSGDYVISDFKDGVCINQLKFDKNKYKSGDITIKIPETIDGKKVLKLSGYIKDYGEDAEIHYNDRFLQHGFLSEFPDNYKIHLIIPSTVTDISDCGLCGYYKLDVDDYPSGNITHIEVSADNKIFSSKDGALYSKDKKWLLNTPYNYYDNKDFVVPESVEYILDGVFTMPNFKSLTIGRNVKQIYDDDFYQPNCTVYIYKNSYADKWFKSIDYEAKIKYIK